MPTNHKMLGTDSDGRLGETVRHFRHPRAAGLPMQMVGIDRRRMTDGFEGRLTGWFGVTVRPQEAQESRGNG